MPPTVSIIIPNFNGKTLLEKNLPSVLSAAAEYGAAEVIVVDDASADGSADWLAREYATQIKLVRRGTNGGFQHAVASGVEAASGELLYFLNSDIRVSEGFLTPVVERFAEPDVFAVSSLAYDNDGVEISGGRSGLHWRWWKPDVDRGARHTPAGISFGPTLFASGGHSAYRAEQYRRLGGFDLVFSPFYWEDVDLCLRAWRLGMKVLFEPRSVVYHDHQKTIGGAYSKKRVAAIRMRNHLIFAWRNIDDAGWWLSHVAGMAASALLTRNGAAAIVRAAGEFGAVSHARRTMKKEGIKQSAREVSAMLTGEFYSSPGVLIAPGARDYETCKKIAAGLTERGIRHEIIGTPQAAALGLFKGYLSSSRRFSAICGSGPAAALLGLLLGKKLLKPGGDAAACVEVISTYLKQ